MPADPDGVRVVATPGARKSVRGIVVALSLSALALAVLWALGRSASPPPPGGARAGAPPLTSGNGEADGPEGARAAAPKARPVRRAAARPEPARPSPPSDPAPRSAAAPDTDPARDEEPPPYEDPIVGFGPPGSGIAAFPPHGSSPPLRGIVVPEDFPLPEGFVRHHQTTDEGEALPPILMFHPDYEWVDAQGEPLAIPEDRVVPPELAPSGLPIRMLELPGEAGAPAALPAETSAPAAPAAPPAPESPSEPGAAVEPDATP
jgi:hypothetical protein